MDWTPMASWPLLMIILGSATCFGLFGSIGDVFLFASAGIWQLRSTLFGYLLEANLLPWSKIGLAALVLSAGTRVAWRARCKDGDSSPWRGHGKVMLLPCRTTHSRLFPKKHSFSYSYLVAGIPVGWEGSAGSMVSTGASQEVSGTPSSGGRSWYHVDARDHLQRGSGHLGLRGKLDAYLKSQEADPAKYPHAYLVTAPRFLGYQFNPASFWYLYDAERTLAAMIVEVNNTFDERRMYYLVPDSEDDASAPASRFTQTWPKDFHVSPFNSRKGSYSIVVTDPLKPPEQAAGPINVTIVLRSSKEHGKIVARLFSAGPGVEPSHLSALQKLKFLITWFWVGFFTFPRIVKEAGGLFFKRKLHVWFRPEPLRESIGRRADSTERKLEAVFRRYLRYVVEQSTVALAVKYIPAGIPVSSSELMLSPAAAKSGSGPIEELEIKVLTPVFYSRFVCYAHDQEAFFCELRESSTIWVSRPELLPRFVMKKPPPPLKVSSITDYAFFKTIQYLRRRPEPIDRPMIWPSSSDAAPPVSHSKADIRGFRISSMDGYVLGLADCRTRSMYRSTVLKLFLAERVALGAVPLLEAQFFMMRALVAWSFWRKLHQEITARS